MSFVGFAPYTPHRGATVVTQTTNLLDQLRVSVRGVGETLDYQPQPRGFLALALALGEQGGSGGEQECVLMVLLVALHCPCNGVLARSPFCFSNVPARPSITIVYFYFPRSRRMPLELREV